MKKLLVTIMSVLMMFTLIAADTSKPELVKDNIVKSDESFEMEFNIPGMEYFPFIYNPKNNFVNDEVVGKTNCEEGYLYSKELETGIVRKLVSVKPEIFRENKEGLYFIYNDVICYVDYLGIELEFLYKSDELKGSLLEIDNNNLVFEDGDRLISLNIESLQAETIAEVNYTADMYSRLSEDSFICGSNEDKIWFKYVNGEVFRVEREDLEYIFSGEYIENVEIPVVTSVNDFCDFPLAEYPHGSYFTYNGSACTSHSNCNWYGGCNCRSFLGCIQCVGFAKYAICKFNHISTWNPADSEKNDDDVFFDSDSTIQAYFASLYKGAYVMFCEDRSETDTHVIVYLKQDGQRVYLYECNIGGRCLVTYKSRPYSDYRSYIDLRWGVYKVTHKYPLNPANTTYINSTYHKEVCSTPGCNAYIYAKHSAYSPGSNVTCARCGYVGNIMLAEAMP